MLSPCFAPRPSNTGAGRRRWSSGCCRRSTRGGRWRRAARRQRESRGTDFVDGLVAARRVGLEGIIQWGQAPDVAVGAVAQDDVGVVAVLAEDAHGRLDPGKAILGTGIADTKAGDVVVDQGAPGLAGLPAVDVEVGVEEVEGAVVVAPDLVVVGVHVDVVLPGPVLGHEGIALEHHRGMDGAGDVLDFLDQAGVKEILGRVADVELGGVEVGDGTASRA